MLPDEVMMPQLDAYYTSIIFIADLVAIDNIIDSTDKKSLTFRYPQGVIGFSRTNQLGYYFN